VPNDLSPPVRAAVQRSRWLADLARSLDHAAKAVEQLNDAELSANDLVVLTLRIAMARHEVESLRRGRSTPIKPLNPYWSS
jgi:hypothetical protein